MRAGAALLLLATIVHVLAADIADMLGWRAAALESVLYGLEASVLWAVIGAAASSRLVALTAVYGLFESVQRVICRPMHPMDRPLILPEGMSTCGAAGIDTADLSVIALCAVLFVWRLRHHDEDHAARPGA
ncbi:MAG: hypothetical protein ACRCYZ_06805 [Alphaproteobacteria bacterium]